MPQQAAITAEPGLNVDKLRDMICFFTDRGKLRLGKTKLMKLLYYADFGFYAEHSRPISGAAYTKYPRGPVPEDALRELPKMVTEGLLERKIENLSDYIQESHLVVNECQPQSLEDDELEYLEKVWARWEHASASTIVSASHAEAPWKSVEMYGEIPYEMAFFL